MRSCVIVFIIALYSEYTAHGENKNVKDGLHVRDSWRLENVLRKVLQGEPLHITIIGGSNSAGGGIEKDERTLDGLYFNVFSDWWNRNIGSKTGGFVSKRVLAIGGTGSYFFAFCYKTFITRPDEVPDIVLVEQSVNFNTIGKAEPLEQLTRQLLVHPSNPAIIFIDLFSGMGKDPSTGQIINLRCTNLEDHGQTELERYYNITSISLRDIICPVSKDGKRWLAQTDMAASDGRHVGIHGHAQVAHVLINHMRNTVRDVTSGRFEISRQIPIVPRPIFVKVPLAAPLCWTHVTPDKSEVSFLPSLAVDVLRRSGFMLSLDRGTDSSLRTDAQGGWVAEHVDSSVVFRVFLPYGSRLRSVILLIRTSSHGGKAQVWLDDNTNGQIKIDSQSIYGQNQLHTVFARVAPGYHYVTVKLVRRGRFVASGLLVGPPDLDIEKVL